MSGETPIQAGEIPAKYYKFKSKMKLKLKPRVLLSKRSAAAKIKQVIKASRKMKSAVLKIAGKPGLWTKVARGGNGILKFSIECITNKLFLTLDFVVVVGRAAVSYNLSAEEPKMKEQYEQFLKNQDLKKEDFSFNTYKAFKNMFETDRKYVKRLYNNDELTPKKRKEFEKFYPWMLAQSLNEYIATLPQEVVGKIIDTVEKSEEAAKEAEDERNSQWNIGF